MIDLRNKANKNNNKSLIVDKLNELINHLELQIKNETGSNKTKLIFKKSSLSKAITILNDSENDIKSGKEALEFKGIGKGIATRIDEILNTGTLKELEETIEISDKNKIINELCTVHGIGESHANKFYDKGIRSINDLKKSDLKLTSAVQIGLKYYDDLQKRIPRSEIIDIELILKDQLKDIQFTIAGSYRRGLPTSGDVDVLIVNKNNVKLSEIVNKLKKCGLVIDVLASGDTKFMGVICLKIPRRLDIRLVQPDEYIPALLYFTGSYVLNKDMRTIALQKNMLLNEYGLFDESGKKLEVKSEKDIFDILDIVYLEPTERDL